MRKNVEVVYCDFCGESIEGLLVPVKVRELGCEPKTIPVRIFNQILFNACGTRYSYDICSKCKDKVVSGKITASTDLCTDRSFTNG